MELVTTSTGVEFEIFKPPIFVLRAVSKQIATSEPKPPMLFVEEKGRNEPNEADPDFVARHAQWQEEVVIRQLDAVMAVGSKINKLPDGVPSIESQEWSDKLIAIGIETAQGGTLRYLEWIRYVAAPNMEDIGLLIGRLMSLMGTAETEVATAIDAFRSAQERGTDSEPVSVGTDSNGDRVSSGA